MRVLRPVGINLIAILFVVAVALLVPTQEVASLTMPGNGEWVETPKAQLRTLQGDCDYIPGNTAVCKEYCLDGTPQNQFECMPG